MTTNTWIAILLAIILILIIILIPSSWVWKITGVLIVIILLGIAWLVIRNWASNIASPMPANNMSRSLIQSLFGTGGAPTRRVY